MKDSQHRSPFFFLSKSTELVARTIHSPTAFIPGLFQHYRVRLFQCYPRIASSRKEQSRFFWVCLHLPDAGFQEHVSKNLKRRSPWLRSRTRVVGSHCSGYTCFQTQAHNLQVVLCISSFSLTTFHCWDSLLFCTVHTSRRGCVWPDVSDLPQGFTCVDSTIRAYQYL